MGETRVKKPKKASKTAEPIPATLNKKLERLSLKDQPSIPTNIESPKSTSDTTINTDSTTSSNEDITNPDDPFTSDPTLIEVRSTPTKGQALYTTRKIPAGTLLLSEPALIRLTQTQEDTDKLTPSSPSPHLTSQFNDLAKPLQKTYLALHDSQKSTFPRLKSIYYSNCYSLSGANKPSKTSAGGSCIGALASRINHSCVPNVQFSFDEARGLMLFHAIRAVPKGREVLSTYDSVFETSAVRQRKAVMYYGFRCGCEACVPPGGSEFWARSDERRRGMVEARKEVRECERVFEREGTVEGNMDPVGALVRLEGLLVKEGLCGLPLADVYRALGRWAGRLGDAVGVERWRKKEYEVCVTCLGRGNVRVLELREKMQDQKKEEAT